MGEDYGLDWGAEYGNDPSVLEPFHQTMANAVNSTGAIQVTPKTSGLADFFHELVVAPSGQQNTGSTVGNVLNYLSASLVSKPANQQQQIVRTGVSRVVNQPSGFAANPMLWIGVAVVVVLVIVVIIKYRR